MRRLSNYKYIGLFVSALIMALATSAKAERGADGEVKVIYWQAASTLNPYLSGGTKDNEAASLILEPLARYDENGMMVPFLVDSIPTVENGGVSADLRSITWKLNPSITWSDGTPLTSADVKFTWEYCTHPEGGCSQTDKFNGVADIETPDSQTVIVRFEEKSHSPIVYSLALNRPLFKSPV